MKILWISPTLPVPTTGTGAREYNLLKRLAAENEFHVVSLRAPADTPLVSRLEPFCASLTTVPFVAPPPPATPAQRWKHRGRVWAQAFLDPLPRFTQVFDFGLLRPHLDALCRANGRFDLVHGISLYSAQALGWVQGAPRVLTANDIESDKLRLMRAEMCEPMQRRFHAWLEWRKLARFEATELAQCDGCLAVSEGDRAAIERMAPAARVHVVPNGVDCSLFQPPAGNRRTPDRVLFFGNLVYRPNIDAALRLCRRIWPSVHAAHPGAELWIVGPNATPEVQALADPGLGIRFVGFVDDVRPMLWQATLSVVPLRSGSGTRLKILESLAAGCPVVATGLGAAGLELEPGRDVIIAEDDETFARQTAWLMGDQEARLALARHGQQKMREKYDWDAIARLQQAAYERFAGAVGS